MATRVGAALALLETAVRPTTPDAERMNAINLFGQMSERNGGISTFLSVLVDKPTPPVAAPFVPYSQQKSEIIRLENDLRERDNRIAALEKEVGQLRRDNKEHRAREAAALERRKVKTMPDGTMSYGDWYRNVKNRVGEHGDRNWQTHFESQTGLAKNRIQKFRQNNVVDEAPYIEALSKLTAVDPPVRSEKEWTRDEVNRLRYYTDSKKMSEKQTADLLTGEFGRRITEGMIKRVKDNSRKGVGAFRDSSFGGPIGRKRVLHMIG